MDNSIAVEVKNLSKKYTLYRGDNGKIDTLRDKIAERVRRSTQTGKQTREDFWALRDVSFTVKKGEVLGVIGRNGAGKSTLLKALARVITPTGGSFVLNGSFSSLLEVGTGFHQELSGRENVYFNGALLGMSKEEIARHFNDIVAYSEIGDFIDMPVKRYSSGMSVRLGFAIAAYLDSDIMIIDEALAVGDAAFRAKSQEVMKKRATSGKTVLFVTHSMGAIQEICDRVIYLDHGKLIAEGKPKDMIELYLGNTIKSYGTEWKNKNAIHSSKPSPRIMQLQNSNGSPITSSAISSDKSVRVYCEVNIPSSPSNIFAGISLLNESNSVVFRSIVNENKLSNNHLHTGLNRFYVTIPLNLLKEGDYNVAFDIEQQHKGRIVHPINTDAKTRFSVINAKTRTLVTSPALEGVVKPNLEWHIVD